MEWSAHCNTEDVRWVLRERSLILEGADPRAFACEIPAGSSRGGCGRRSRAFSTTF